MNAPATSSGLKSATANIMTAPGRLRGLLIHTDGTNNATVTLYDNKSGASGVVLAKYIVPGASLSGGPRLPEEGVVCNHGIHAVVSGTGAEYIVHYDLG